ncbi:MAG TPA: hypothetical protein VKU90_06940 [Caulobacteraceae bacterium]|nr:hypothetical protein [Caulobacteraceae bacterium]
MTDPIDPVDRPSGIRRVGGRVLRVAARAGGAAPAPARRFRLDPAAEEPAPADPSGAATFAAQVIGQPGQKRGLRGGPETLDRARHAYLEAEYSGHADRRPSRGRITKTEI